jgi:hypothetical protein
VLEEEKKQEDEEMAATASRVSSSLTSRTCGTASPSPW